MCGIVALHSIERPIELSSLRAGMDALNHRGPDGEGCWIPPHGRVGLGHRRLSVIDLDTGNQPISNECGSVVTVVNGELYDFERIRRGLEKKGHSFQTRTDSEILVHLYEEHGTQCLEHLRGEFAFVLWDETRQTLFAARDRFGIKPLFYAESAGVLYLASEAKALFAAGVTAAWDHEAVFQSLFLCVAGDNSLFSGIRQVPPGHFLTAAGGAVSIRRYWDADYPLAGDGSDNFGSPDDCIAQVRGLLDDAIRLRMRADVPVGCLLSGGLDSSAVLGFASRQTSRPMRAFTIAFDDPAFDESGLARHTAEFVGAEFEAVDASNEQLADNFGDSVWHGEIIQYNAHGTARFLLSRAIQRSGYKVVLAGEGADELFAGYGFCSSAILSRPARGSLRGKVELISRMLTPLSEAERSIRKTSPWLVRTSRLLNLSPQILAPLADRMGTMQSVLSHGFAADFRNRDPYRQLFEQLRPMDRLRGREPAKQLIYLWMQSLFPGYILAADRADMAHGVEVRLPFLDHVLFDYVRQIPVSLLAAGGRRKHVLREAAAPVISQAVREREKKPLLAPPFTQRKGNRLNTLVQDTLRSPSLDSLPFLDARATRSLLESSHRTGKASVDPLLLMSASLCVLHERFRL